jgi:AcrR family transcriptional regulator
LVVGYRFVVASTSRPKPRPGGRTARTRAAVHAAVCDLLADGRDDLSVREVAERSEVHEVTIYRRWGSIESLVLDVAVTRLNEESPFPDTGDLGADLLAWAEAVASQLQRREGFALYRAIAASAMPGRRSAPDGADVDVAGYLKSRGDQIQRALDRHAANGGHPPTVEMVLDTILAPLYLRAIWGYAPNTDLQVLVERAMVAAHEGAPLVTSKANP